MRFLPYNLVNIYFNIYIILLVYVLCMSTGVNIIISCNIVRIVRDSEKSVKFYNMKETVV